MQDQTTRFDRKTKVDDLKYQAVLMYLETAEKNYGLAGQHADQFFNRARGLADDATNVNLQQAIKEIVPRRDAVMTALASQDPNVGPELQTMFRRILGNAAE